MTTTADAPSRVPRPSRVTIDGQAAVTVAEGTTIWTAARDAGIDIPVLCHDERMDPVGVCRMCVVDVGGRVLRRVLRPAVRGRMEVTTDVRRDRAQPRHPHRAAARRPAGARGRPEADDDRRQPAARAGRPLRRHRGRAAARPRPRHRHVQPGHRGRPRRLHPLRPLRAGLRRPAGQRRHRPQRQGLLHPDLVRPRRPDGRVVLRHLRRVRGGLPDRRADQQADPRRRRSGRAPSSTPSTASAPTAGSAAR